MITLRLTSYSNKEKEKISNFFETFDKEISDECTANDYDCKKCPLKHLCDDLFRVNKFFEIIKRK